MPDLLDSGYWDLSVTCRPKENDGKDCQKDVGDHCEVWAGRRSRGSDIAKTMTKSSSKDDVVVATSQISTVEIPERTDHHLNVAVAGFNLDGLASPRFCHVARLGIIS